MQKNKAKLLAESRYHSVFLARHRGEVLMKSELFGRTDALVLDKKGSFLPSSLPGLVSQRKQDRRQQIPQTEGKLCINQCHDQSNMSSSSPNQVYTLIEHTDLGGSHDFIFTAVVQHRTPAQVWVTLLNQLFCFGLIFKIHILNIFLWCRNVLNMSLVIS